MRIQSINPTIISQHKLQMNKAESQVTSSVLYSAHSDINSSKAITNLMIGSIAFGKKEPDILDYNGVTIEGYEFYDVKNKLIKSLTESKNGKLLLEYSIKNNNELIGAAEYDKKHRKIKEMEIDPITLHVTSIKKFSPVSKLKTKLTLYEKGSTNKSFSIDYFKGTENPKTLSLHSYTGFPWKIYEYDEKTGNKIQTSEYTVDGKYPLCIIDYDPETNMETKLIEFYEDSDKKEYQTIFDKKGYPIETLTYDKDGETIIDTEKY